MIIRFWGTRGSIPTPGLKTIKYGGNTSCIEIRTDGLLLIFDAGTGIRELGNLLLKEFKNEPIVGHIFISHTHWDHIQGIPFFIPAYQSKNEFTFYGPKGTELGIEKLLRRQMEKDFFPVPLNEMKANLKFVDKRSEIVINKTKINFQKVNHPGITYAHKVESEGKLVVYTSDNEPNYKKIKRIVDGEEKIEISTSIDEKLIKFAKDADLLICDSQYVPEEYKLKVGWGHSTYEDAVSLAIEGNVKQLVLFHYDPTYSDEFIDGIVKDAKKLLKSKNGTVQCIPAKEGLKIKV
jgi:ribonuclease BN (tRNA processing enzyme)